ncbi:hypothetical protein [Spirochaeta africana]|nr:hypothetical protein [Spirochaeta africana]
MTERLQQIFIALNEEHQRSRWIQDKDLWDIRVLQELQNNV